MASHEVVGMVVFFILAAVVLGLIIITFRRIQIAKIQSGVQTRFLEKLGGGPEALAFLESEAGQRFMELAPVGRANPYSRILGAVQTGLILTFVGGGLFGLGSPRAFFVAGMLASTLGSGFLTAAAASYILSKQWGLFDRESNGKHLRSQPLS